MVDPFWVRFLREEDFQKTVIMNYGLKFFLRSLVLIYAISPAYSQTVNSDLQSPGPIIPISNPSGVFFHSISQDFVFSNSRWRILLTLPLKPCNSVKQAHPLLIKKQKHYLETITGIVEKEAARVSFQFLTHRLETAKGICANLQDLLDPHPRKKRALIDVGGQILKKLFGVSTTSDVTELQADIAVMQTAIQNISQAAVMQLSILNSTSLQIDALHTGLQQMAEAYDNLTHQDATLKQEINKVDADLKEAFTRLHLERALGISTFLVTELVDAVLNLDTIVRTASSGRLHPALLNPHQLKTVLHNISLTSNGTMEPAISSSHIHLYYNQPLVETYISAEAFQFLIEIPLKSAASSFQLYLVRPLPVLIRNSTMTSQVIGIPSYLAVNKQKTQYFELDASDLFQCSYNLGTHLCPLQKAIHPASHESCSFSLFIHSSINAQTSCRKQILTDPLPSAIRLPGTTVWILALPRPNEIILHCPRQDNLLTPLLNKTSPLTGLFQISLPSRCTLQADGLLIPQHFSGTSALSIDDFAPTLASHGLVDLFKTDQLEILFSHPLPKNDTNTPQVPQLPFPLQHLLAPYEKRPIDFDTILTKLRDTQTVFTNKSSFLQHVTSSATWLTTLLSHGTLAGLVIISLGLWLAIRLVLKTGVIQATFRPTSYRPRFDHQQESIPLQLAQGTLPQVSPPMFTMAHF